jgi:Ca2+-binding RTX toxin-like protein
MARLLAAGAVSLLLLALPAAAEAATVSRISNSLIISAASEETSRLHVHAAGGSPAPVVLVVTGPPGSITAGSGCDPLPSGTGVECGAYPTLASASAILGNGDDRLTFLWPRFDASPPSVGVAGRRGADRIVGGSGVSQLDGGAGNDRLGGEDPCCGDPDEGGNDILEGGPGADVLFGGADDDDLDGGPGADTADYSASQTRNPRSVRVDLRRGIATGPGTDSIDGCERVLGSDRDDVLSGTGGRDLLEGRDGDDVLRGRDGRDKLRGGRDEDVLRARDGRRDLVDGGRESDRARVDAVDILRSIELL